MTAVRARTTFRALTWYVAPLVVALVGAAPAAAQGTSQQTSAEARLRAQQDSLDKIRRERDDLEHKMLELQGRAHDLNEEVTNLSSQAATTAAMVRALDSQLEVITLEVDSTTTSLTHAEDELHAKEQTLHKRVTDIYKRGPLHSMEVMLSAASFADLIARYKWLHLVAQRDKALVKRVRALRNQISDQRDFRVRLQAQIATNLQEKEAERRRLKALEQQQSQNLKHVQQDAAAAQTRLTAIAKDEARITSVIAALDAERRRNATPANAASAGASALRAGAGLAWPVDGEILYPFGQAVGTNNTLTKWNGIGIKAPEGTPVRAVGAGLVVSVDLQFLGYGPTVIIQHAGGDYSVYSSMGKVDVMRGDVVSRAQVIGTVGVNDPRLGPHLHFEIRPGSSDGTASPVDPLRYLRPPR